MTQPTGDALAMIAQLQQEAADLRRQLALRQLELAGALGNLADERAAREQASAEAAELRRQLAEAQAEIAALRIENAAIAAIAAICPTCGGSGEVDSGGVSPWGAGIEVTCPTCNGSGKAYNDDATPLMWETATAADLRRQLAEAQAEIARLRDEVSILRDGAVLPPPTCGHRGMAGSVGCILPAGHAGPHEYRTFADDHAEQLRRLSPTER